MWTAVLARLTLVVAFLYPVVGAGTVISAGEATQSGSSVDRIVFSRDDGVRSDDIFIANLRTGRIARLTAGRRKEWDPDLSPSGRLVVYRRNPDPQSDAADIWLMRANGTKKRKLTHAAYDNNWSPAWSPNGRQIAYSSSRGTGEPSIWAMRADGRGKHRIGNGTGEYPDWSPDGQRLVFAAARDSTTYNIYTIGIDGKGLRQLTNDPGTDFAPAWSPDGKTIAFQTDRDGRWRVWLMDPDGSNQRPLDSGEWNGAWPAWLTSNRLAYAGNGIVLSNLDGTNPQRLSVIGAECLSSAAQ